MCLGGNIMFVKKIYFIIFFFFFIGCGADYKRDINGSYIDEDKKSNTQNCSQKNQKKIVYNTMRDSYLWYEYLPDIEYNDYNSTQSLLDDLRYSEYDKWSYITSATKYNNLYEKGLYEGFGFSITQENGKVLVSYVYADSPADIAGFRRGTEILEINGNSIYNRDSKEVWRAILDSTKGQEAQFKIANSGIEESVIVEKSLVKISSIFTHKILYIDEKKIGYFVLNGFIEPTRLELDALFDEFKREGIDELILDMRYNGGGRVSVANYLANLIGGDYTKDMLFERLEYNDKNRELNTNFHFQKERNSLNLDRVFIISTNKTCSASETVINGLKPYIAINLIGSKTCGKPVGMSGVNFCGKHLAPIEFKIVNANGDSDYFAGIEPICYVSDDTLHKLGDKEESMLKETLFFIKYNICSEVSKRYISEKSSAKRETSQILSGFHREINAM
jgi:C-terminal processing protease CtpA/Prc